MADKAVFKIDALTEGGFVTYAPDYSQYSETLQLAANRLRVQVDAWVKIVEADLKEQAKAELPNPANPRPVKA
jgi:hypothetical protein